MNETILNTATLFAELSAGSGVADAVRYHAQTLTQEEQATARGNIGAQAVIADLDALRAHTAAQGNPHQTAYEDLEDIPDTFPPEEHTHEMGEVIGLGDALSPLNAHTTEQGNPHHTAYEDLLEIPEEFPPETHLHFMSDIDTLTSYLNGFAARFKAVWALMKDNLMTTQTDSGTSCVKDVPEGAVMATVKKIGGRTVLMNELTRNSCFRENTNWSGYKGTCAIGGGCATLTADGTADYACLMNTRSIRMVKGHKYFVCAVISAEEAMTGCDICLHIGNYQYSAGTFALSGGDEQETHYGIITANDRAESATNTMQLQLYLPHTGATAGKSAKVWYASCVDLTKMFGAGNEPQNAQACFDILGFHEHAYDANGTLRHANVVSVEGDGRMDLMSIAHYEGYGVEGNSLEYNAQTRKWTYKMTREIRAYQTGDEDVSAYITDGKTTVVPMLWPFEADVTQIIGDNAIGVTGGGTLTVEQEDGMRVPVTTVEEYIVKLGEER